MKKVLRIATVVLLSCASCISAFAEKKVESKSLGPENSWQEVFDITEHQPGKYNILVEGEDKAGNVTVAGPYNIFIDPKSDLPVTGITNPVNNMRVPGNLNIVGTCVDDDEVTEVWLILDGDEDHPVKAEGKEFWSYFLTTTELFEGPHTIEAYGIDNGNPNAYRDEKGVVDESRVVPKTGNRTKITWQLDRRAPVIEVNNLSMGSLVSGKINLEGRVTDGNGINRLEYSLDGGISFTQTPIREVKYPERNAEGLLSEFTFSVPLDTTKFEDGVATCWFRARDNAGSVGRFAFLFFVDNTPPDIRIITPEESEVCNGVFTVAGVAKDKNGIQSLRWQWGLESGEFELTPGNPYWTKEVSAIGKTKSEVFTVIGRDTMDNEVVVKRVIPLDPEADKPVVTIGYPSNGIEVSGEEGALFVRGIARDDDGVVSVTYKVDAGEEKTMDCLGVFNAAIDGQLAYGTHTLTAWATDRYGVKGNPTVSTFTAKGPAPSFSAGAIKTGSQSVAFTDGMTVHPESDSVLEIVASSTSGISAASYKVLWGTKEISEYEKTFDLKGGEKSVTMQVPLNGESLPWGIVRIQASCTDIFGRESVHTSVINVRDITKTWTENPGVYFTDSTVAEDGIIEAGEGKFVTGYFAGARIASVALVPSQKGVELKNENNLIRIGSAVDSDEFAVQVTTDSGATYTSRKMKFRAPKEPLVLELDEREEYNTEIGMPFVFETPDSQLKISGKVSIPQAKVAYRIFSAEANLRDGVILTGSRQNEPTEWKDVEVGRKGTWEINDINFDSVTDGCHVVEILAQMEDGRDACQAVYIKKIPLSIDAEGKNIVITDEKGKPIAKDVPRVYTFQGRDYYGVCVYQGELSADDFEFSRRRKEQIQADEPPMVFSVTTADTPKPMKYSSQPISVSAPAVIRMELATVDGEEYRSGMEVSLNRVMAKDEKHEAVINMTSNTVIKTVSYKITGENAPGGNASQSGNAPVVLIASDPETHENSYTVSIPLVNLPARITQISATATDAKGNTSSLNGTISVIREHEVIDNEQAIYWYADGQTTYNEELKAYVLNNGSVLTGYCNVAGPLKEVYARGGIAGIEVTSEGNMIRLKATADGTFRGVSVRVNAEDGGSYLAPDVSIVSDTSNPAITVTSPESMIYVKDTFLLSGRASDGNGSVKLAYTLGDPRADVRDKEGNLIESGEIQWTELPSSKAGEFWINVSLKDVPDGYIPLTIRATDSVGKITYEHRVLHKDTTPPEVQVILPEEGVVVNGETTVVFRVRDEGRVSNITYTSPSGKTKLPYDIYIHPEEVPVKKEKKTLPGTVGEDGTETPETVEEVEVSERFDPLRTMNARLPHMRVGTPDAPIDNKMTFTFTDDNGNKTVIDQWQFTVDEESDKPVSEIHLPEEMQVVTADFVISGIVYDDDGPCKIFYKIDKDEYKQVEENASSFKVNIPLLSLTDNEHTISVYGIDVNGVKGDEFKRVFRVSLEEPKGAMTLPEIKTTVKETVTLQGWASDKNDIELVQISVDNGATYNDAEGTTEWSYKFNTQVIQDGTHVVFIRIFDKYGISALYSSLINIDNTPPDISLDLPLDDSKISKRIFLSGETKDNIELTALELRIRSLDGKTIPERLAYRSLESAEIITQVIDISELSNGFYNIELTGKDAAGNITRVSRNIELNKSKPLSKVSVLYPLNGEHVQGEFNIYGITDSEKDDPIESVDLYIDQRKMEELGSAVLTKSGYFKFTLKDHFSPSLVEGVDPNGNTYAYTVGEEYVLAAGPHFFQTIATTKSGKKVLSNEQTFIYKPNGPWVTLENFTYGDFARNRPLLEGNAGYILTAEELAELKDKTIPLDRRIELENRKVKQISISFDNGKTYEKVAKPGKTHWEYRVENLDIPAGYHFMLVKAEMHNGENAITRTIVQVDRTNPSITLISPGEGGRYNQQLKFSGLSGDDVDLNNVELKLRKGDKASYEVPKFIEGLYFDASVWGATLYSVGVGLTAFDGAVKVQANFGQFTQQQRDSMSKLFNVPQSNMRFGGNVFGGKILAQLAYVPFRYFLGRDWDWLSATVAVGANFSYFTDSGASIVTGEKVAQILSAALVQVEFPRVTFQQLHKFKTWAMYTEPQIWFIPSDVGGDSAKKYVITCSVGIRANVF